MSITDLEPGQVTWCPDIVPDLVPMNGRRFKVEQQPSPREQLPCADVVGSDDKLIIGDT